MENKGAKYEKKIWNICSDKELIYPNTTNAGGGDGADVFIAHQGNKIAVECKTFGADYGQNGLYYQGGVWKWNKDTEATKYLESLGARSYIPQNFIPFNQKPTDEDKQKTWSQDKKKKLGKNERIHDQTGIETSISVPKESLEKFYNQKECFYIQIDGYGFYHLGEDKYSLGTAAFDGELSLRFRAKSHDNFERYVKINHKKKKLSQKIMIEEIMMNVDSITYDPSIFSVIKNGSVHPIYSYDDIKNIIQTTTGKEKMLEDENVIITKNLDGAIEEYVIKSKVWNYNFFAALKLSKKPTRSLFSIEESATQKFPFIKN